MPVVLSELWKCLYGFAEKEIVLFPGHPLPGPPPVHSCHQHLCRQVEQVVLRKHWFNFQLIEELTAVLAGVQGPRVKGGAETHIELGSTVPFLCEIPSVTVTETVLGVESAGHAHTNEQLCT